MTTVSPSLVPLDDRAKTPSPTLSQRENLISERDHKYTGFTPRPQEKLSSRRLPRSMTNIECSHFLRTSGHESATGNKSLEYMMWKEAGKHEPPIPARPDTQYNSNVWRNFRRAYGFYVNSEGQKVSEMIANMYPMNVPAPSQVREYTYSKFLRETPLIKDEKRRQYAIDKTAKDIMEFKRMRLRSDMRNPPLDKSGNIVPPVNFRCYAPRFIPPPGFSDQNPIQSNTTTTDNTRIDIFGQEVPKAKGSSPYLWKLKYKLNHPQYVKVKEEMERRRELPLPSASYMAVGQAY